MSTETLHEKKTNNKGSSDNTLSMHEKYANLYLISLFTVFPLYMTDKLFNVRTDRLHYFIVTTMLLLFFICANYICFIDKEKWPKHLLKMSVTDCSMLLFIVTCVLSTVLSAFKSDALTGAAGRDSGLALMAVYFLCYFILSRYLKIKEFVFDLFVLTGCVVCLIAILHEFYFDPFNIVSDIVEEQRPIFLTTIGNINIFSNFVCVVLPIAAALAVMSKDKICTALYYIALGIIFMGLIVANSDSGYVGLIVSMSVLFVFCCGSVQKLFRYFLSVFVMLISTKVLYLVALLLDYNMIELDTIPHALVFGSKLYIAIAAVGMITVILFIVNFKSENKDFPKAVQIIAGSLTGAFALGVVLLFCYFSFINKTTDLGSLTKYLRLNDQWGTHRGYAWIRSVTLFKNGGIKNMLIGTGPDTFGIVMKAAYYDDMLQRHGSVFDSAHNEYLNYLVTVGFLGMAAYITAIVSLLVRCIRSCNGKLKSLIVILVVISYASQAIFNIATPIVTPYIFVFLGIGEAILRRVESEKPSE